MAPFRPAAATVAQATSTSSTAAVLIPPLSPMPPTFQVRVVNAGTTAAFFKFGASGVGAASATADVPVRGGETAIFTLTADQTHFRVIAASATPTVYLTAGYGS